MVQTTVILSIVALLLILVNTMETGRQGEGLSLGLKQMLRTASLILGAFILAGMIEVLIPGEICTKLALDRSRT